MVFAVPPFCMLIFAVMSTEFLLQKSKLIGAMVSSGKEGSWIAVKEKQRVRKTDRQTKR